VTQLVVLGSGSKGNAFALVTPRGILLVEAGFGPKALARRAAEAGLAIDGQTSGRADGQSRLLGILLTHEHGDHASGALALAALHDAPVLCTSGTWQGLGHADGVQHVRVQPSRPLAFEGFTIDSCLTTHDAREPVSLAVTTPAGHRVAFATDIGRSSTAVRYLMREANAVVVESNYDEVMLRMGRYPPSVQQRIAGSGGHLSNRAAAGLVADVVHPGLTAVVLAHLSQACNTPAVARETVEPILRGRRFGGAIYIAEQDCPLPSISVRGAPGRDQGELALHWGGASPAPSSSGSPAR
jgi:phosphoribosyl 1,2-cyclic phosphodiesterase